MTLLLDCDSFPRVQCICVAPQQKVQLYLICLGVEEDCGSIGNVDTVGRGQDLDLQVQSQWLVWFMSACSKTSCTDKSQQAHPDLQKYSTHPLPRLPPCGVYLAVVRQNLHRNGHINALPTHSGVTWRNEHSSCQGVLLGSSLDARAR